MEKLVCGGNVVGHCLMLMPRPIYLITNGTTISMSTSRGGILLMHQREMAGYLYGDVLTVVE